MENIIPCLTRKASFPASAGEKVLDSVPMPAIAIRGSALDNGMLLNCPPYWLSIEVSLSEKKNIDEDIRIKRRRLRKEHVS